MSGAAGFDVRAYARDPHELRPADLDLESLRGLARGTLEVLVHLWCVERGLLGADVTGAQMTTSGLDTAVLAEVYRRLAAAEPRLAATARQIVGLKERHRAFFAEEAATRLSGSANARRLARAAVSRWRWPGTRYCDPGPVAERIGRLVGAPADRAGLLGVDAGIAALPGLGVTRPVAVALGRLVRG